MRYCSYVLFIRGMVSGVPLAYPTKKPCSCPRTAKKDYRKRLAIFARRFLSELSLT